MYDILVSAWQSISRHRLRSLLAVAGIAVGVCALTSIMSTEQSWRRAVIDFFSHMDLETVQVKIPAGDRWREEGYAKSTLDEEDARAITKYCSAVDSVTLMQFDLARAETDTTAMDLGLRAVAPDFTKTLPDEIRQGRLFTAEENAARAAVCLLSYEAKIWLYGDEKAVGRNLRINGRRFQIVGVISGNRHIGIGSRAVYIPISWSRWQKGKYGFPPKTEIFARTQNLKLAADQIEALMRQRIGGNTSSTFTHSLWKIRATALASRSRAALYCALAGLCALLAAGIGIAAVLFVSITERAPEIGIRRALGATRRHIYCEYLFLAVLLAGLGGLLGGLAAIPASALGAFSSRWQPIFDPGGGQTYFSNIKGLPELSSINISISWEALGVSLLLALLVGLAAAVVPASEAASINPAGAIAQRAGTRSSVRKLLTILQLAFGVVVLIVLTSYFSVMQTEERAAARKSLGQDRISASADPIAAMRKPFPQRFCNEANFALAQVLLSKEKMAQLQTNTPLLTSISPVVQLHFSASSAGNTLDRARVVFTNENTFSYEPDIENNQAARAAQAFAAGEPVAVITPGIQDLFFGDSDPLGRTINIAGKKFTIIAVRGKTLFGHWMIWVPIAFYPELQPRAIADISSNFDSFNMETRLDARPLDTRQYTQAGAQLRANLLPLLSENYRKTIKFNEYIPETTKQFIFQYKAVAARGAVGASAVLLVALIGLANMLLVSVYATIRETGLRRALGAQKEDVLLHFLYEGVLLSSLGALIGAAVGFIFCSLTKTQAGLPVTVSLFWLAAGSVTTVLAGAVISFFPALVASRIHPVEALHYE